MAAAETDLSASLREESSGAGFSLDAGQLRLAVAHAELLLRWNATTNLTRIVEPREVARRHFVESFQAAELLGPNPPDGHLRVLDVGAGGGFPGLAARIVRPELELTLLEPRQRKASFLRRVAALHAEPRPLVRAARLEQVAAERPWPVVTFRAVHLRAEEIRRVLEPGGRVVGFPGGEERWSAALEGAGFEEVESRKLDSERRVVAWRSTWNA